MTNYKTLRALCDAATDGEWTMTNTATSYAIRCNNKTSWNGIAHVNKKLYAPSEANARFIAATDPQTVIGLIDEVENLRGALEDIADFANKVDTESYGDGFYLALAKQALGENNE